MSSCAIPGMVSERPPGVLNKDPGSAERLLFHDADMAEVALLLPSRQAVALERMAQQRGLTVAQLIRHLICESLASKDLLPGSFAVEREQDKLLAAWRI